MLCSRARILNLFSPKAGGSFSFYFTHPTNIIITKFIHFQTLIKQSGVSINWRRFGAIDSYFSIKSFCL
ncbi:hypothetical protein QVD17_20345 [Tagetes erecta]|uniref:Uncharacterized protein n=1 Tax=Tagetes erecta TaxID=13708 RepID=A0AAD8KNZ7_TARER|nr:hypothetical protein QVD17_20345 [Tagetes erecta]